MAEFFREIDDRARTFIEKQKMFFVASAPEQGRVNLSPKGMDSLRVLGRNQVAYLDLTGSGNETAAHLRENGRMTLMVCSFDRQPLILRVYGRGRAVLPRHAEWQELLAHFEEIPGTRQVIVLDVDSVQTSCGYAVPEYEFKAERTMLRTWAEKKGADGLRKYQQDNNTTSLDGLSTGLTEK